MRVYVYIIYLVFMIDHTHTHTHTNIYIYIYIYIWFCIFDYFMLYYILPFLAISFVFFPCTYTCIHFTHFLSQKKIYFLSFSLHTPVSVCVCVSMCKYIVYIRVYEMNTLLVFAPFTGEKRLCQLIRTFSIRRMPTSINKDSVTLHKIRRWKSL